MTEWRPVVGFEGFYEISADGQVRGCRRIVGASNYKTKVITPKLLKPSPQKPSGHLYVSLYRNRKRYHRAIHRMVLESFISPYPTGLEACHRDGDTANNTVDNLYWGTRADNVADMMRHGNHRNQFGATASRTACEKGHEYVEGSYSIRKNGGRCCLVCNRVHQAKYKAKTRGRVA